MSTANATLILRMSDDLCARASHIDVIGRTANDSAIGLGNVVCFGRGVE